MALAKHIFEKYGWMIVGTITPTDKKSRSDHDIPFLKLSNGARNEVERGWFREAVIELKTKIGKRYYIQCTAWLDKKQVCFLNSNDVGFSDGMVVKRHSRGKRSRDTIASPRAQTWYVKFYSAVDKNDRDSADWSSTIKTSRYYLRIFFWGLDRVVHTLYVVVCYLAGAGIGPEEWKKYCNKNSGRHDFQIDLGIALINYGVGLAWDGNSRRPDFMRQGSFVPCDCGQCFFCINGHTTGISHNRKSKKATVVYTNKKLKVTGCSKDAVALEKLSGSGEYCRMCYNKLKGTKFGNLKAHQLYEWKRRQCNWSIKGCSSCEVPICEKCWDAYNLNEHKYK